MKTDNVKSEIVWKGFRLGNFLELSTKHVIKTPLKNLHVHDEYHDGMVGNVTASKENNGIVGYIEENEEIKAKKIKNILTLAPDAAYAGVCFYQKEYIVSTGHNKLIEFKLNSLKELFDRNEYLYLFLAKMITKIFCKTFYGFSNAITENDFNKEIILLPCLEVSENDEYIWEENGRYYTLAVEYIKELMEKAKERKEARTIRMYEAERAKYEAERAKYEAGYNAEKPNVLWKGFRLGNLFEWSGKHRISKTAKQYDTIEEPRDGYIANITAGKYNEGIANFIPEDDEINSKKRIDALTISSNGNVGACFFHDYYFISTGDNALLENKYDKLQEIFDTNHTVPRFFAKLITKMFMNGLYSWGYKVSKELFNRELILLPCLEVSQNDEYIWEENGRYYTLATNYISYLYLTGKVNKYQKLIDTYTYTY